MTTTGGHYRGLPQYEIECSDGRKAYAVGKYVAMGVRDRMRAKIAVELLGGDNDMVLKAQALCQRKGWRYGVKIACLDSCIG